MLLKKRHIKRLLYRILVIVPAIVLLIWLTIILVETPKEGEMLPGTFDFSALLDVNVTFRLPEPRGVKRDWHDYEAMEADKQRAGLGEHGVAAYLMGDALKELERNMSKNNRMNALLSDRISLNRALPDVRPESCKHKRYLAQLPTTSIVIIFYNEHLSVMLRTLHSIVNRTPAELLKEIILVDDCSDRENLRSELDKYIADHFPRLVRVLRLPERKGLIAARLVGARHATGDVLVFFDAHIECTYNWLPPLLEPIALNRRICTCPIIDTVYFEDFSYRPARGWRGAFSWTFDFLIFGLLPSDDAMNGQPFRSPVMMGGLLAIDREFFWELGGYDELLDVWGGEQYELSFKIWMCGGMLLDVPCSHVGHIFPDPKFFAQYFKAPYDYFARNIKRVAMVWMDEYKEYVFQRNPHRYKLVDAGDLTAQRALRERLQCKTFKWYMEAVLPELSKWYPPKIIGYASGALQNVAYDQYCLDTMSSRGEKPVGLYECQGNKSNPHNNQNWQLTFHRDVHARDQHFCLDVHDKRENATVWLLGCHRAGGNQFWYYDREHQWLVHGRQGNICMEALRGKNKKFSVVANKCDAAKPSMKWIFGYLNHTALDNFYKGLG